MELSVKPDLQAKLDKMARQSGRPSNELVEDALIGYFNEVADTQQLIDRRLEEMESGTVKPIEGEEAFRRLMEKTEAQRRRMA